MAGITIHSSLFRDYGSDPQVAIDLQTLLDTAEADATGIADDVAAALAAATTATAAAATASSAASTAVSQVNTAATTATTTLNAAVSAATTTISGSVTAAATSATNAATSATAAAGSATTASTAATAASGSATAAAGSATAAAGSATTASTSASGAATSASNAAGSATSAAASATVASTSAAGQLGFRNAIINGSFAIWQRGTSLSPAAVAYTADMWVVSSDGTGGTVSVFQNVTALSDTSVLAAGLDYSFGYIVAGSPTGGTFRQIFQRIENPRTFAGKTVRLSFWAKTDAARSVTTRLVTSPGTGGSPAGGATTALATFSMTTAWTLFTATATLPAASTITPGTNNDGYLRLVFDLPVNVAVAIALAGVQLELNVGATTSFELRPTSMELTLAQRYFQRGLLSWTGYSTTGGSIGGTIGLPATMRSNPTSAVDAGVTLTNCGAVVVNSSPSQLSAGANVTTTGVSAFFGSFSASSEL